MLKYSQLYIFIGVVLSFISLLTFVAYQTFAFVFALQNAHDQRMLLWVVFALSWGFVLANIVGNYSYNIFTRAYYRITAVWLGFLSYVFMVSIAYATLIFFVDDATRVIGKSLIVLASIVTLYGIIHARDVRIKKINVAFSSTPLSWRGRSAVWVSDLHLGQVYGMAFLHRVVAKINTIAPEMLFIGGDLFDGTQAPDLKRLISPLSNINKGTTVYFVTGNHEEFGDSSPFLRSIREIGIRVLSDEVVEADGVQIIGVDYRNASHRESFKSILQKIPIDRARPSILLKHEPKDLDVAEEAGISLQLSGHTHRAQFWPLRYIARVAYKRYEYGLKKLKGMWVYTSSGVGSWGPPVRVGSDSEIVHITFE